MKISLENVKRFRQLISRIGKYTASIEIFAHDSEMSNENAEVLLRWFKAKGCPIEIVVIPELNEKGYRLNDH